MYYNKFNKTELVELCKKRGLDATGNKPQLVSRLLNAEKLESKTPDMFRPKQDIGFDVKSIKTLERSLKSQFFLQIKSANLSNYFNFGCIYPLALEESEIYKTENRAKDILSIFENYIIVSNMPFNQFEPTDVLIELVLNGIEVNEFEESGLFYISEPIPVSRIKAIYFETHEAKATFISSTKAFPDSFVPISICKVSSFEVKQIKEIEFSKITLPYNETLASWKEKLNLFDKILGLFAFIKNIGIFYAERENKFENYTAGLFSTLAIINPIKEFVKFKENSFLKPLLQHQHLEISNAQRAIFKLAIECVYSNKTFDIKTAIDILESSISSKYARSEELSEIKEQIELFNQLANLTISYKGVLQKEVVKKNLPTLALLFLSRFSNKSRQNTDKQAVRISFIDNEFGFPMNVAEYILGFLGLYYGYKNMIKEDTNLKFNDKLFESLAIKHQSIKFKLESYFDRFLIESSFQFATTQMVLNNPFDFLNWEAKKDDLPILLPIASQYDYVDKSYSFLGERIISIQRRDKKEKIFEKIANQYSDKIENTCYLATFLSKYLRLDKRQIIELLKKNLDSYPIDELEKVIDLDNQNEKK